MSYSHCKSIQCISFGLLLLAGLSVSVPADAGTVSPDPAEPGQTITATLSVVPNTPLNAFHVVVNLFFRNGAPIIGSARVTNVNFSTSSPPPVVTAQFTIPSGTAGGLYGIDATINDPNTGALLGETQQLATFTIGASQPPPPPGGAIRWHPGHYMTSNWFHFSTTTAAAASAEFAELAKDPNVLGWKGNYYWAALKPTEGNYNFSVIDAELAQLKAMDPPKRLVMEVFAAGFLSAENENLGNFLTAVLPAYLTFDTATYGPSPQSGVAGWWYTGGGFSFAAAVWRQAVMNRYIALIQALGAHYSNEPYFDAIILPETASMVATGGDFTDAAFLNQLEGLVTATTAAFPNANVALENNYLNLQHNTNVLTNFLESSRGALGGPDILGETAVQQFGPAKILSWGEQCLIGLSTPDCTDIRGDLAVLHDVEEPELDGTQFQGAGAPFTPLDIYNNAEENLHANYLFWTYMVGRPAGNWSSILSVINANPIQFTQCPKNYASCITN